ncbi:MAG TPA: ADYC domain-containing protein [Nannocystis sp.]
MMMKSSWLGCMTAAVALSCLGCDGIEDDGATAAIDDFGEGSVQARLAQFNGTRFNGTRFNGYRFNSSLLYGSNTSEYVQLYDFWHPDEGYTIYGDLVGGELHIENLDGWDVEGGEFNFKVKENGVTKWKYVWIKRADPVPGFSDVWEYDLDMQIGAGPWEKLCLDDNGNPIKALLIGEVYDPVTKSKVVPRPSKAMTFACKDGALAKCVLFGYRPWASHNGTQLADYHQACTRMVRADYCGNGDSHTEAGVPIHVLDQIGIQNAEPDVNFEIEAEWGPNGAVCLNPGSTRIPGAASNLSCNIPTCGTPFASGGLIQSGKIVP